MTRPIDELDLPHDDWLIHTEFAPMIVGYEAVQSVFRDPRWHSGTDRLAPTGDAEFEQWKTQRQSGILALDGNDHDRMRHVLAPLFTPSRVEQLRPMIRRTIDELLDAPLERGATEFVGEVCKPYPRQVVFHLLGADQVAGQRFGDFVAASKPPPDASAEQIIAATEGLDAFAGELLDSVRETDRPGVLAAFNAATDAGTLSRSEAVSLTGTVLLAGTESTQSQLGLAAFLFAEHADQFDRLRADPELGLPAVEEILRFRSTVRGSVRVASCDIEIRDVLFPRNTLVSLSIVSANRDERVYVAARDFDIGRTPERPHLTFGHGTHFCVGAALARAELQEAVTALAARVSRIELDGEVEWLPNTTEFWGPRSLPLALA